MGTLRLGVIGTGSRGRNLVSQIYAIRDRQYLYYEDDHWSVEKTRITNTDRKFHRG